MSETGLYLVLPVQILEDQTISDAGKILYAVIGGLTHNANKKCFASNEYLANKVNKSKDSIVRLLKELENAKYITREVTYKSNSKEVDVRYITVNINLNGSKNTPFTDIDDINNIDSINSSDMPGRVKNTSTGIVKNTPDNIDDEQLRTSSLKSKELEDDGVKVHLPRGKNNSTGRGKNNSDNNKKNNNKDTISKDIGESKDSPSDKSNNKSNISNKNKDIDKNKAIDSNNNSIDDNLKSRNIQKVLIPYIQESFSNDDVKQILTEWLLDIFANGKTLNLKQLINQCDLLTENSKTKEELIDTVQRTLEGKWSTFRYVIENKNKTKTKANNNNNSNSIRITEQKRTSSLGNEVF